MVKIFGKRKEGLTICHINAQSLNNKIDEFRMVFENSNIDIVCVSETWLSEGTPDSLICLNAYKVFRTDRDGNAGGVAIFVRNSINCKCCLKSRKEDTVEFNFVEISSNGRKLLVGCVYRPNKRIPLTEFVSKLETISVLYDNIVISGDFNSNILTESILTDDMLSLGLTPVNHSNPTHFTTTSSTLLDIFLVANMSNVVLYDQVSAPCFSKHDLIFLTYNFGIKQEDHVYCYRDFKNLDFNMLHANFLEINWNDLYYMNSADEQLSFIEDNVQRLYDNYVPLKSRKVSGITNQWFSAAIKQLIEKRDVAYSRWKRFRTTELKVAYRNARSIVNNKIRFAKTEYYSKRFGSAVDSKRTWKTIREIGVGNVGEVNNCHADCNELNSSFLNIPLVQVNNNFYNFSTIGNSNDSVVEDRNMFEFSCVSQSDVFSAFSTIKSNAVGYDNMHPKFINILLPLLLPFVTHLFNTIIMSSSFPLKWKHAKIIPLPKSDTEFRPVAILCFLSKVLEKLLHIQMDKYMKDKCLLSDWQSGFRSNHSCITALVEVSERIRRELDDVDPSENDHDDNDANSDRSDDDEENDEIADDGMVEKTFKFDDFAKRLLNPKIVRACVVVLSDWEQIPTKSLKAAVTILHRIAYGCSCPAMLYQAKLFRIFQQVLHAARDAHHEELRRLGSFVVRKFVETAPNNPKIYAELLFYKSIKEANELEMGYCDAYEHGTKGTWSEEQEAELRFLFEENQRNPETDKDVIDWILENVVDKTRTRRGVLKKLKEMGLMFKAPTKKSTAANQNKNLWPTEEDEELRSLYDQYRTEDDVLQRILDEFEERRNKQQIIKRMLQLHIIADKSEIMPQKPKKRKSKKKGSDNEDNDEDEYMEEPMFNDEMPSGSRPNRPKKAAKAKKRKIVRTPLDVGTVRALIAQIDEEKYKESIEWLKECLDDAADDTDEPSEEDDGVPLVPLQQQQKDAMEDDNFKKVLVAVGIQPPVFGIESYWRIPTYLNSADIKLRAKIIGGEEVEIDVEDLEEENDSDQESDEETGGQQDGDESEEDYLETLGMAKERKKLDNLESFMDQQREKMKNLMFSKSDEETEERAPLKDKKKSKNPKKETKSKKKKNVSDSEDEEDPELVNKIKKKLDKKKRNFDLSSEEEEGDDENTFKKPKEKEIVKPNTGDLFDQLKAKRASNKIKLSDMVAEKKNEQDADNDFDFNSEDYRKRLAELEDDDNNDDNDDDVGLGDEAEENKDKMQDKEQTLTSRSRRANVIESDSDEDDDGGSVDKVSSKNKQAIREDDDNIADGDDDNNGVKAIRQNKTGDNIDDSNTLTKKRRRSLDADNEKTGNASDEDVDEDAAFLARKKPSPSQQSSGEEPAKRRRIAIIDDDDEDD